MSAQKKERTACPVCHNSIDSDSKRCSHCGATIESKNKIFKDFVNRWEKIEGSVEQKGSKKKCPLCSVKLRVPPFKCKDCEKYYDVDDLIRASDGLPHCPKCRSQVELSSEEDLELGVKIDKCRECGYRFKGNEGYLQEKSLEEPIAEEVIEAKSEVEDAEEEEDEYECPQCGAPVGSDTKKCH